MASEWNRALKTLKRVLEGRVRRLPTVEMGQPGNYVPDPQVSGLRAAISEIDALIEPEEE
ncbi:hypothetical protein SEA_MAGRITTE_207 [Microbacterium phage Magritte]|nr:hypothetical protein SEA_MAGRITTE_207 [Microbacterium phage Magritte]